jgi:hypothetical protein
MPDIKGIVDVTAKARGRTDRPEGFDVSFNGVSHQTMLGETALGDVTFNGKTQDQKLTAELLATLDGRAQRVSGDIRFGEPSMPFSVSTTLDHSPLTPFISLVQRSFTFN